MPDPLAFGTYEPWLCLNCLTIIPVSAMRAIRRSTDNSLVKPICPVCYSDQVYFANLIVDRIRNELRATVRDRFKIAWPAENIDNNISKKEGEK